MSEWHKFGSSFPPHGQLCYVGYRVNNGDGDGSTHLERDMAKWDGFEGWRKHPTGGKFKERVEVYWMIPECPPLPA